MHALVSKAVFPLMALAWVSGAQAATVAGTVTSTLVLTSSCLVNGAAATGGMSFGTLNFGTANSLFTQATGQVLGGGGGALSILCSAGTSPSLTVSAGANDGKSAGGGRALYDGVANYVPYDLYTDSGHSNLLAIGGVINLAPSTGVAQAVNIYGKASGKAGLPAGTYTDTVAVTLTF
ncbi:spore coat protein [Pseudomonas poae]|uniref:Spore coat protein n=1 Tax=Pseudomonas poae TaxID=200451 RepID=A0A423ESW2_9PSED|nr:MULTISPECIES: spore coat U domain-containing protein [Pseudomonas]ROM34353.1 spore coat protein [Pseudomonas poae]TFF13783.1 SCPU domain-containing protein [Pseudomonas sp. JMN1]TFF15534.1 SCPU domain-containing protein [Pseudomonas sp. BCA17]TFF31941.1 SCPU domain-containing protein [Pseudomonas sp. BCA14]TFF32894.1 SCPU domain-containing protein [Pseudomonas sp. BCA13]